MEPLLQLNLFSHHPRRLLLTFANVDQIAKMKPENKEKIKLVIFTTPELKNQWEEKVKFLNSQGLLTEFSNGGSTVYIRRTLEAVDMTRCPYSGRIDDDQFIGHYLWDYLFENLSCLDSEEVQGIIPLYTSSVPTTEYFIDDFMTPEDAKAVREIFKRDSVPKLPWHPQCDYTHLINCIASLSQWDSEAVLDEINRHPTPFRGIHPIRFSTDANVFVAKKAIADISRFVTKNDYRMVSVKNRHYTHFGVFRTDMWRNAISHRSDDFDETGMNNYRIFKNMAVNFVRNGFAIHASFNYAGNMKEIEEMYSEALQNI